VKWVLQLRQKMSSREGKNKILKETICLIRRPFESRVTWSEKTLNGTVIDNCAIFNEYKEAEIWYRELMEKSS